jgi:plasmid stabilization system protein ParE
MEAIFEYLYADASAAALAWFGKLAGATTSLSTPPLRNPAPPEDSTLRQLHFGTRPHVYRIIYDVDTAARTVSILHVRHGARDAFKSDNTG